MQKKFKKEIGSLDAIFNFIHQFIITYEIQESLTFKMNLIVEEVFTNLVKYNRQSLNDILINLTKEKETISICMTDFDVHSFNVTESKEPNIYKSLKDRTVGGLGLHLVRKIADKMEYEYKNGNSVITLLIKLEN